MTKSPIVLRRINKLIGQALRAVQLAKGHAERLFIRSAIRWLNRARYRFNNGLEYRFSLTIASLDLASANQSRKA